jgi:hypothetical protein
MPLVKISPMQLMEDLKRVHPGVMVYVLALQKANPAQISWLMYLH